MVVPTQTIKRHSRRRPEACFASPYCETEPVPKFASFISSTLLRVSIQLRRGLEFNGREHSD